MQRWLLLLVIALLAAGCSAPAQWTHPDKGERAFNRDKRQCWSITEHKGEGRQPTSSEVEPEVQNPSIKPPGRRQAARQKRFEQCMFDRGWHKINT